jgi:hypothetical protein
MQELFRHDDLSAHVNSSQAGYALAAANAGYGSHGSTWRLTVTAVR